MKLRDRKTGEIREGRVEVIFQNNDKFPNPLERHVVESFAELNADWEEFKEPIIEDEKVRKFVRDWAEMNGINEIIVFDQANSPYIPTGQVVFAENAGSLRVCFRTDEKFDTSKIYTITELCGKEEE